MFAFALVFAAALSNGAFDVFVQRLSDNGYPPEHKPIVTAGALPPNWTPPVPLPQGVPLLGSVLKPHFSTEIYYEPKDATAAAAAYAQQLRNAGFMPYTAPLPGTWVFGILRQRLTIMCHGRQSVSISTNASDDLRLSVSDPAAQGACAPRNSGIVTPVPQLVQPAGVTILNGGGGTASYSATGDTTTFSSAQLQTKLSAKALLAAFASQMRAARWQAQRAFAAPQTGAQTFTYAAGPIHWKATIMLFPTDRPHTYDARFAASGSAQTPLPQKTVPLPRPAEHLRPSDEPAVLQLAERIAGNFGEAPVIYLKRFPPNIDPKIPLPQADLLGSLARPDAFWVYYNITRPQYDAYVGALRASGWSTISDSSARFGFTVPSTEYTSFCKPGFPVLSTSVTPNRNDFSVSANTSSQRTCTFASPTMPANGEQAPAVHLAAPADAKMEFAPAAAGPVASHVTIGTTRSLAELLAGFAAQFTAQKWKADAAAASSDGAATQTFSYTDGNGTQWRAVLTVLHSQTDANSYDAFLNLVQQFTTSPLRRQSGKDTSQ